MSGRPRLESGEVYTIEDILEEAVGEIDTIGNPVTVRLKYTAQERGSIVGERYHFTVTHPTERSTVKCQAKPA